MDTPHDLSGVALHHDRDSATGRPVASRIRVTPVKRGELTRQY
jgi:hypothetical protein